MNHLLDLTPLAESGRRLAEGLARYRQDTADTQIRDGLIQRFEFTYEISHKMLKRYLESASATPSIYVEMPFADLIRSANQQGLLKGDWVAWKSYRDTRSRTSHSYDEAVALEVVDGIPAFVAEAEYLLAQLQTRTRE